jgi:putative DNA primase/helicase
MFGLFGPPRSGKGVTQALLQELVGFSNIYSTSLDKLTSPFGMAGAIHKKVLLLPDVKDGSLRGQGAAELLLKISGEDLDSIARKYAKDYEGKHTARVVMCGNAPPRMPESSPALLNRFILLSFKECFLGREDMTLTTRLRAELPGIFNRAMRGLEEWRTGAEFTNPAQSLEYFNQLRDGISSIPGFIETKCELGSDKEIDKQVLYEAYKQHCETEGIGHKGSYSFFRDLYAHHPTLTRKRIRHQGVPEIHAIGGIKLIDYDSEITLANGQTFVKNSGPDSTVVTGKTILKGE